MKEISISVTNAVLILESSLTYWNQISL